MAFLKIPKACMPEREIISILGAYIVGDAEKIEEKQVQGIDSSFHNPYIYIKSQEGGSHGGRNHRVYGFTGGGIRLMGWHDIGRIRLADGR